MILPVLIAMVAGWLQRHQQQVITYLIEENRILKAQLGGRRLRLTPRKTCWADRGTAASTSARRTAPSARLGVSRAASASRQAISGLPESIKPHRKARRKSL